MQVGKRSFTALLIALAVSIPSFSATPDRITGALNSREPVALRGAIPRRALPQYDQGPADPALNFGSVMLRTIPTASQQQALTQLLAAQQDRKSPNYHKWLTPEQWADRFGLSPNDVQKITSWLASQGFTKIQVARGGNWFVFDGTAAQIQSAFGTEIHRYNVNGEMHVANATAPKIPAALAGIVTGIHGLDDFYLKPRVMHRVRPRYYSSTYGDFLAPGDVATIYDISPLYNSSVDGTGQKLAIIGQTDIYLSDINDFRTGFGLTSLSCTTNSSGLITSCNDPHFQYVLANSVEDPGSPSSGDLGESDLDLEWSGAVARGAQLIFVNTPYNTNSTTVNGGGVWESWYYAVDQDLAPVISMSYGNCEFDFGYSVEGSSDETELQKANSEGITFVNSSGDSGAAECDPEPPENPNSDPSGASATGGYAVSYPASSPEVTAAGGSSISNANLESSVYWGTSNGTNGGSALSYIPEQAWNDDYQFYQLCAEDSGNAPLTQFCENGDDTKGWVSITNQQTAQEDMGISSSGGGPSNCAQQDSTLSYCVSGFAQPSWQKGVTISGAASARFTPDVSFIASPNFPGYIFCTQLSELGQSGTGSSCASGIADAVNTYLSIIGGTSVSAPLFAGIVTLLNQSLSTFAPLGNVNPMLYQLAADSSNGAFHQVTSYSNTVYCTAGTPGSPQPASVDCPSTGVLGFNASTDDSRNGYNLVTGLGSVDVNNLTSAWTTQLNGFALSASSINPTTVTAGNGVTATITVAPSNRSNFSGTVSFSCTNQSGISCSFSPTSVSGGSGLTTVTISVPLTAAAGATSVTLTGTSGSVSATTTVSFTVTATTESFSLSSNLASSATLSVQQGQTGQVKLTVSSTSTPSFTTSSNGNTTTALPLTYGCSGLPNLSSCTFSPASPSQATAVSVSITTTASTNAQARPLDRGNPVLYAVLSPGLFGIMFIVGAHKRSRRGIGMLGLILLVGVSTLWLGSCGGGSNSSNSSGTGTAGTTPGNYTVTVSATTGGSAPIRNSYQFTLTVAQ
jgi:subtilase family serine protease